MLRYAKLRGDGLEQMSNQFVGLEQGGNIPLSEIADIRRVEGPVSISP